MLHLALMLDDPMTRMGFEPKRANYHGLAVHHLNHSATSSQPPRENQSNNPFSRIFTWLSTLRRSPSDHRGYALLIWYVFGYRYIILLAKVSWTDWARPGGESKTSRTLSENKPKRPQSFLHFRHWLGLLRDQGSLPCWGENGCAHYLIYKLCLTSN